MKLKWPPKSFPGILKVLLNKDYKSIWRFKGYGKVNSTEKKKTTISCEYLPMKYGKLFPLQRTNM